LEVLVYRAQEALKGHKVELVLRVYRALQELQVQLEPQVIQVQVGLLARWAVQAYQVLQDSRDSKVHKALLEPLVIRVQ